LLLGVFYKANTADARNSPAIAVAEQLVVLGANVRAADPTSMTTSIFLVSPASNATPTN
jgi:UDP-glucose 6-dehydrogenase